MLVHLCLSSVSSAFFCGSRCVSVFMVFGVAGWGAFWTVVAFLVLLVVGVGPWGARALFHCVVLWG